MGNDAGGPQGGGARGCQVTVADALLRADSMNAISDGVDAAALITLAARVRELEAAAPEGIAGRCVEIGDDDEGRPRLVIHTTRGAIMAHGRNLAFADVVVSLGGAK